MLPPGVTAEKDPALIHLTCPAQAEEVPADSSRTGQVNLVNCFSVDIGLSALLVGQLYSMATFTVCSRVPPNYITRQLPALLKKNSFHNFHLFVDQLHDSTVLPDIFNSLRYLASHTSV
jgi:hypothetical protein